MWDECNCVVVWAFFGIAFLRDWDENWLFLVPWPQEGGDICITVTSYGENPNEIFGQSITLNHTSCFLIQVSCIAGRFFTFWATSAVLYCVAQLCLTLCDPMDCNLPGASVHGDSPGKNPGVGWHFLLQGILPTHGWNSGLPHCRQIIVWATREAPEPQGKPSNITIILQRKRGLLLKASIKNAFSP